MCILGGRSVRDRGVMVTVLMHTYRKRSTVHLSKTRRVGTMNLSVELGKSVSHYLIGALLLEKYKKAEVLPGGCDIGSTDRLIWHIKGFRVQWG